MNTALLQHAMVMPYFRSLCEQWNVSPLSACAKCAELQFDCFISCSSELTANSANSPPVYMRLNAAGVYSVWCKRVFGCRGMVFLKSATWFFFFLLAQWKPVREVNSNSGSLHIKGSSEEFQSISLKKNTFIFCCVAFLGARVLTAGFLWPPSVTPIGLIWLARYWCTPVSVRQEIKGLQYNKKSSVMSWLRPLLWHEYLKADNRCKRDSPPHGQRFWKLITVLLSGRCFSAAGK